MSFPGQLPTRLGLPALWLATLLGPAQAAAQARPPGGETPDGHGFDPAPLDREVRDPVLVQRVGGWAPKQGYFTGLFEYASDPLVWCARAVDGVGCIDEEALLDDVFALNLSGGYAPTERLRLYANLPTFLSSRSDHTVGGGGMGDLRIGGQVAAFRGEGPVLLGFVPWLDLPTGDQSRYLGDAGVGGGAAIAGSVSLGPLTLSADLGAAFTPESNLFPEGMDSLLTGLAAGVSPTDSWGLTAETRVSPTFLTNPEPGTGAPAEVLYSAKHRRGSLHFQAGLSHALTAGPGAAQWRAFAGLGWTSTSQVDLDGDGFIHESDDCPYAAEAFNDWYDEDGCPEQPVFFELQGWVGHRRVSGRKVEWEVTGALPNTNPALYVGNPGRVAHIEATYGGCFHGTAEVTVEPGMDDVPVELVATMGSLRLKVVDQRTGAPVDNALLRWLPDGQDPTCHPQGEQPLGARGSLTDSVGSGRVRFVVDAPDKGAQVVVAQAVQGRRTPIEVRLGPARTRLMADHIALSDNVWFHYNSATIEPDSLSLLGEVAAVLLAHPELGQVQVVGHTDDQGEPDFNLDLSRRRAEAVARKLVALGVPEDRLEVVGHGSQQPIAPNATARGRAKNRRVEFVFTDQ